MGAMTRTERLWRVKDESKARSPYTCPHCGSGALALSLVYYRYPDGTPEEKRRLDRRGTWVCVVCRREFCEAN
jgi:ribosomal protein L37AE/L43A